MGVAQRLDVDAVYSSLDLLLKRTLDVAVGPEDFNVFEVAVPVGINLCRRCVGWDDRGCGATLKHHGVLWLSPTEILNLVLVLRVSNCFRALIQGVRSALIERV
jgi:hypothetical protein